MIQPEYREKFLRELRDILPQTRRLEACISLEVGEVADQPGMFVLPEHRRNGNEYLNEILQLPFYQRYLREICRRCVHPAQPSSGLQKQAFIEYFERIAKEYPGKA